jgi:hypothetical protein
MTGMFLVVKGCTLTSLIQIAPVLIQNRKKTPYEQFLCVSIYAIHRLSLSKTGNPKYKRGEKPNLGDSTSNDYPKKDGYMHIPPKKR